MLSNKDFASMIASSGAHSQQRFSLEEVAKMDRLNAKKMKKPIRSGGNKLYADERREISEDSSTTYRDRAAERRQAEKLEHSMPQPQIPIEVDYENQTLYAAKTAVKEKSFTDDEEVCLPMTEMGMKIYQLLNATKTTSSQRKDHLKCQVYSFDINSDNDTYLPNTLMKSRLELNDAEETLTSYVPPHIFEQLTKRTRHQPNQQSNKASISVLKEPEKAKDLIGDIFEGLDKYVPDFDNETSTTQQVSMDTLFTQDRHESIIESVKSSAETSSLKSIAPTLLNQLHDEKNSGTFFFVKNKLWMKYVISCCCRGD